MGLLLGNRGGVLKSIDTLYEAQAGGEGGGLQKEWGGRRKNYILFQRVFNKGANCLLYSRGKVKKKDYNKNESNLA